MADVQSPEIPVVLACQDNVFVAVPHSLLTKESSVFRAELSNIWQNTYFVAPVAEPPKKRRRNSKTPVKGKCTTAVNEAMEEEANFKLSELIGNQPKVIQIKEYKSEAVKFVIEWIKGYTVLLSTCYDIQILADMIMFADYYDIQRPMMSLATQMESSKMNFDNVISTMGVVEKLERLASAKDISMKLELRCKDLAISYLKYANTLSKFVRDNCDNIDLVTRLLDKCEGRLVEPRPLPTEIL